MVKAISGLDENDKKVRGKLAWRGQLLKGGLMSMRVIYQLVLVVGEVFSSELDCWVFKLKLMARIKRVIYLWEKRNCVEKINALKSD